MPPMRDPIATEVAKYNFPQRPPGPHGVGLKTFVVQGNNFLVTTLPKDMMHHYDIGEYLIIQYRNGPPERARSSRSGDPNEISKAKSRVLVHTMQIQNPNIFNGHPGAYDGRKNLYLSYKPQLQPNPNGTIIPVTLPALQGQSARPTDQFLITIKFAATVDLATLRRFVGGGAIKDPNDRRTAHQNAATAVMFLNEVLRRVPVSSDKWIVAGRTFYSTDSKNHKKLDRHGLVLISGFFQSVRPCLEGINVTIDSAVGVMYPAVTLMDLVIQFLGGRRDTRMLSTRTRPSFLATIQGRELGRFLKNLKVFVNKNKRAKKITALVPCARDYRFTNEHGDSITVEEHFKRAYNFDLRFPEVFCVQVGENQGKAIVYPIEVCDVKPGQLYRRTLSPEVTREMQTMGGMRPHDRLKDIQDGFRQLDLNTDNRHTGIVVDNKLLAVNARSLPRPSLWFRNRNGAEEKVQPPPMSNYTLPGKRFNKTCRIASWGILAVSSPNERDVRGTVQTFAEELGRVLANMGMRPSQPHFSEVTVMGNIEGALDALAKEVWKPVLEVGDSILIVVVLPPSAADARHRVKYWGDVVRGVPTQCVKIDKIRNVKDDYLHNLSMKINVRTGGTNCVLGADSVPWGRNVAMIVGADVSHPPAGESLQPSVAAMCASTDGPLCEYIATSRVQAGRQEVIQEFKGMMEDLIDGFLSKRKQTKSAKAAPNLAAFLSEVWPTIMVIYRDGVGEGQYASVSDEETRAAREALAAVKKNSKYKELKLETDAPPTKITYIIVSKKHHQRFFPKREDGDKNGNCFPGSVFDQNVAHPTLFDFWLQSQAAIIGTARPAHYIVCHDENSFRVDVLQRLSYYLCYVYARATRSVSIPAPVYYADLICGRSKFMFEPVADSASVTSSERYQTLEQWQAAYHPLHKNHKGMMYFI
ncbi:Piwi-domain-containing protein [Exidia glandulosa HHB12029]|uniref:Piwi-domain-containing protein n=1 Tax=Exidia glandulosa HHB12029 TaxID=1314781 RepID=A0A165KDI0_EXIGL|nr:Piwi-domain-containing protein [Exidia glandulosa HHB12029]